MFCLLKYVLVSFNSKFERKLIQNLGSIVSDMNWLKLDVKIRIRHWFKHFLKNVYQKINMKKIHFIKLESIYWNVKKKSSLKDVSSVKK